MAALLAGQGVNEVATEYHLDKAVVSRLKNGLSAEELQRVATQKGAEIEQLLFTYLTSNLKALDALAEIVSEREYIIKQPADSLAVLHGVMADKSIRLLEAIERARQPRATQIPSSAATNNGGGPKI